MQIMYMRFDDDNAEFLSAESERTGLSRAKIVNEAISAMRRDGWSIAPARVIIRKAEK
jgi:hypothetical protein